MNIIGIMRKTVKLTARRQTGADGSDNAHRRLERTVTPTAPPTSTALPDQPATSTAFRIGAVRGTPHAFPDHNPYHRPAPPTASAAARIRAAPPPLRGHRRCSATTGAQRKARTTGADPRGGALRRVCAGRPGLRQPP
ncbi:hypothetical protein HMPREF1550_02713, partial [Actinomyces sp. oral taxon 877 str. F0543]